MSEELFVADQAAPNAEVVNQTPEAPKPTLTIPAVVSDLIGEGKKYATVEAALASIPAAQSHISTLEGENAEYKNKLMANDKLDQVLDKLSSHTQAPVETAAAQPVIDRDTLSALVQQEIAQTTKVNQEEANLVDVKSKLQESYGDNAGERWSAKAAEAGMTTAQLTALAKVAPKAVLKLVGETKSTTQQPIPTSDGLNLSTVGDIGNQKPKKNIMFGASTKDTIAEWKASAVSIEE